MWMNNAVTLDVFINALKDALNHMQAKYGVEADLHIKRKPDGKVCVVIEALNYRW